MEHGWVDADVMEEFTGRSALGITVHYDFLEVVKLLVSRPEVDINLRDKEGVTPLGMAIRGRHMEIAGFLLSKSACEILWV
jgi:ankyrin repeat protein